VQHLGPGAELTDVQREFPGARLELTNTEDPSGLVFIYFTVDQNWDSAVFEIKSGHVASVSLIRGVVKKEREEEKREWIIDEALKEFGPNFSKTIARSSEKRPEPVFVWRPNDATSIYLSIITPLNQGAGDKEHIRLVIAPANRAMAELFDVSSHPQNETAVFDSLMGESLRKRNLQTGGH